MWGEIGIGFFASGMWGGGVPGWQNANRMTLATASNPQQDTSLTMNFTDFGCYLDPYKTGKAPPWVPPSYAQALADSQRYWYPQRNFKGLSVSVYCSRGRARHPVPMRVAPSGTIANPPRMFSASL
jgi:hypothetical protein